jgi:curved DNA-binding protein CbpA
VAQGFDPYAVLGVSRDATVDQIAQARRRLSRQYHPDVNPANDAAARFDEVQRAFNLLADPAARAAYDHDGRPGTRGGPGPGTGKPGLVAQPAAVDFGRLGPARPEAYAKVTVSWTGARASEITRYPRGEWWKTVASAVGTHSGVALFDLRAEFRPGMPAGPQHSEFTVTLGDASVTVPLTAEFGGPDQPPARGAGSGAAAGAARPTVRERVPWRTVIPVLILVLIFVIRIIFLYVGGS